MLVFFTAVAVALVVSFMCSIFESVLLSIGHAQVEAVARKGGRAGELLRAFKRKVDVPIAAILIVNTIAHTIGAAVAGASYSDAFNEETLWIFTIVFTAAVLLLTEIIPKTLGVTHAQALAVPVAYGIHVLTVVLRPLVWLTERISRSLRGPEVAPLTSVEEIRLLAALGRSEGVVGSRTAGIIVGATRLGQLRADQVMIPRQSIVFLSAARSIEENLEVAERSGHSRFPFSPTGDLETATGIVLVKDLLFHLQRKPSGPLDWRKLVREPLVVPESKPVNELLRTFREERVHMAMVVDEYGQLQGIVTLEDVLEEMVGEIVDESDREANDLGVQPDGSLDVHASIDLRRVCAYFGMEWDAETSAASVGGLLNDELGRLPRAGDVVEWNGCRFTVRSATPRRAERVTIRRV